MNTKLTIDEIELAIVNSGLFNKRGDIFVPNVSWGLLNHEADMVVIDQIGILDRDRDKTVLGRFQGRFQEASRA